ncbi:hypothetical protein GLOTRDRAFT_115139 [Gloeophyllum trabeum ATCC 11539]|uniref:Uncharacterized protein n=1 Tax=Gloeophyllum trabeum (strain ATCC 11539 / FP-39264 / Madison 617) TaxID=670483 RepID=S7RR42_GLOTA|nr:uncharacterized protein GLOTRDRAFT_115139 [Gloeophyllum trabeum ATCC 11539]EPQ57065.1 hypothetical protein GLOTRDRAFT_115139 [Gloeophyllum trabeum ATCC 11539]
MVGSIGDDVYGAHSHPQRCPRTGRSNTIAGTVWKLFTALWDDQCLSIPSVCSRASYHDSYEYAPDSLYHHQFTHLTLYTNLSVLCSSPLLCDTPPCP